MPQPTGRDEHKQLIDAGGVRTAIFDLDGTLIDSAADLALALNYALAIWTPEILSVQTVRTMIGDGVTALIAKGFMQHGLQPSPADSDHAFFRFMTYANAKPALASTVFPRAAHTLEMLHAGGVKVGVCTNKVGDLADAILIALGLQHLIDIVVGGDGPFPLKPNPAGLLATIDQLGGTPQHAIYVGDMLIDAITARSAGVDFIGIDHGHAPDWHHLTETMPVASGFEGLDRIFQARGWLP